MSNRRDLRQEDKMHIQLFSKISTNCTLQAENAVYVIPHGGIYVGEGEPPAVQGEH